MEDKKEESKGLFQNIKDAFKSFATNQVVLDDEAKAKKEDLSVFLKNKPIDIIHLRRF